MSNDNSVTQLLRRWQSGERQAVDELMPLVYGELQRLARRQIVRERVNLSLQATGLVHEAYVRLVDADVAWQGRVHFFALAARAMCWSTGHAPAAAPNEAAAPRW